MKTCVGVTSVLRRYCVGAAGVLGLALLTGCAPAPAPEGFRDPAIPMGQTTRYTPEAMAGPWVVQARFGTDPSETAVFTPDTAALATEVDVYPVASDGLIVMWLDADNRTAVLGTVDGITGFILDRSDSISNDRYVAAVDVLDFYGWDTGQLERVK